MCATAAETACDMHVREVDEGTRGALDNETKPACPPMLPDSVFYAPPSLQAHKPPPLEPPLGPPLIVQVPIVSPPPSFGPANARASLGPVDSKKVDSINCTTLPTCRTPRPRPSKLAAATAGQYASRIVLGGYSTCLPACLLC